jgi:hypothetical protein
LTGEPKHISIDLGSCPGWTLQRAKQDSTEFVRCLSDDEFKQIATAATFCRKYALSPSFRLLFSSYRVWRDTLEKANAPEAERVLFAIADELQSAFIGWLLIWRLIIDQADHDISERFGGDSNERSLLRKARSNAYDNHQAYRVVEATRNLVQHREMPPFNFNQSSGLDPQSGQITRTFEVTLPASWLLDSPKCPATIKREFEQKPTEALRVTNIVDDAMAGFQKVLITLVGINQPELAEHTNLLRGVFSEVHPGLPVLIGPQRLPAGARVQSIQIQMAGIDDLLALVRDAPVGNPYQPGDNDDQDSGSVS